MAFTRSAVRSRLAPPFSSYRRQLGRRQLNAQARSVDVFCDQLDADRLLAVACVICFLIRWKSPAIALPQRASRVRSQSTRWSTRSMEQRKGKIGMSELGREYNCPKQRQSRSAAILKLMAPCRIDHRRSHCSDRCIGRARSLPYLPS
jgi:hypothetical protein